MTWRDRLQPASFKGAAFHVDSHELAAGRRVQLHEYPLRDKPFAEDLGRKSRTFSMTAFVLGADYMAARDALLRVVEERGAGKLVHPYFGELQASCVSCKLSEGQAEGGLAKFALEFVEAGEALFPRAEVGTGAAVRAAADNVVARAAAAFTDEHSVAGKPAFVAQASVGLLGQALQSVQAASGRVTGAAAGLSTLQATLDDARRDLLGLVYTPANTASALVGSVQQLQRVATSPRDALSLARSLYGFGAKLAPVAPSTTSRRAQAINQIAIVALVRSVAVAEGARAAAQVAFASFQEATTARDELLQAVDGLTLEPTLADAPFNALRALRAAIVRDVATRGANLARVVAYTPPNTLPGLVVAQQLYADAQRAGELLARNGVRHPLFVAGGRALEVLTDA